MATVADIENVLLRLALTDDAGLERVIEKLLPILLSNVTKEDSPVRVKVQRQIRQPKLRFTCCCLFVSGFGGPVTHFQAFACITDRKTPSW
jgi:hypothetical protein